MIVEVEQVIWQNVNHLITPARRQLPPSRKHIPTGYTNWRILLRTYIVRIIKSSDYELLSGSQSMFKVLYSGVSQYGLRTLIGGPMVNFTSVRSISSLSSGMPANHSLQPGVLGISCCNGNSSIVNYSCFG